MVPATQTLEFLVKANSVREGASTLHLFSVATFQLIIRYKSLEWGRRGNDSTTIGRSARGRGRRIPLA